MNDCIIQRDIVRALNLTYPEPWGAYPATTRDNIEFVEFRNEKTGERFIITIQKGM